MVGSLPDVITCAKFQVEILGVTILQGVEFPIFLLIFEWALQQCSATALPVMLLIFWSDVVSKRTVVRLLVRFAALEKLLIVNES